MSFPEIESLNFCKQRPANIYANNLQKLHSFWYGSICLLRAPFLNLMQLSFHIAFSSSDSSDCNLMMRFSANSCPLPKLCRKSSQAAMKLLELIYQFSHASTQPILQLFQHIRRTHPPCDSVANLPGNAELSSLPVPAAREDGALHPVTSPQVWTKRSLCSMEGRNKETGNQTCLFGVSSMKNLFGSGLGRIQMKCLRISCFLFVSLAVPPNSVTYVVLSIGINVDRRSLKAYTLRRTSQESLLALHISIYRFGNWRADPLYILTSNITNSMQYIYYMHKYIYVYTYINIYIPIT